MTTEGICPFTDEHVMTCGQMCYPIDVAIAIEHMVLKATEEGLGTCWVGAFHEEEVKKALDIPKAVRVVELLALGYAQEDKIPVKQRLNLKEIVMFEKWRGN